MSRASRAHTQRAAQLVGAAEALFDTMGGHLDSAHMTTADRTTSKLGRARIGRELDAPVFTAQWAEGQAVAQEQGTVGALAEMKPLADAWPVQPIVIRPR